MKRTEYISFSDRNFIDLLQNVGDEYAALELIDENNDVDAMVISLADFDYLISKLDEEEKEQFVSETTEAE
ncbi:MULTISPECIES: hypothetical protein [Enterococcus]|uniref:hypothetical protein n=1 Tax=Enterococcus TaxID=1350 RepID=UPI00065E4834|nr:MULTISPECIES: hypothetical protein [Enterococcus]KAF1302474.1 hypothetical protein BAU16_06555 [Enterococcus sp. JM9B]